MRGKLFGTGALLAVAALLAGTAAAQTITGTVVYEGTVPKLRPVAMDADPVCATKHKTPVESEVLVLGPGNSMANVLVSVIKGLPAGQSYPAPKEPVVMDQKGCKYSPHVMGLMVNQPFKVLNSDGLLHNVHALPKLNQPFNMAMPPTRTEATQTFTKEEGTFTVKCDVHPWMQSYVGVFSNPFFAVTASDGKFTIPNLPAGTYEIEAWHEKLGTRTQTVEVGDDGAVELSFVFGDE